MLFLPLLTALCAFAGTREPLQPFNAAAAKEAGWDTYLDPDRTNYGYELGRFDSQLFVRLVLPKTKCDEEDDEDCRDTKYSIPAGAKFLEVAAAAVNPYDFGPVREELLRFSRGGVTLYDGRKEGSPVGIFKEKDCELTRTKEVFPLSYAAGVFSFHEEADVKELRQLFSAADHEEKENAWEEKTGRTVSRC